MRWLDVTRNLGLCVRELNGDTPAVVHEVPKLVTKLHKSWKKLVHEGTIIIAVPDGPNQVQMRSRASLPRWDPRESLADDGEFDS